MGLLPATLCRYGILAAKTPCFCQVLLYLRESASHFLFHFHPDQYRFPEKGILCTQDIVCHKPLPPGNALPTAYSALSSQSNHSDHTVRVV